MNLTLLHYTLAPVVGGVEVVLAHHAQEFMKNGQQVTLVAGRGGGGASSTDAQVVVVPELDSQYPGNLQIAQALERGALPPEFQGLQARIVEALAPIYARSDLVLAHNVFNCHFNLPLTAALHQLIDQPARPPFIAWCHDISRYVNPTSGADLRHGFPWDLLRTYRPDVTYVAVSRRRRQTLATSLGCPPEHIQVIPNGVDARTLLGLSDRTSQFVEDYDLFEADLIALMPIRITRAKNIEYALRVLAALKERGLCPRLIVTGPPDPHSADSQNYWGELRALRDELKLAREAIFLYEGTARCPGPLTIDEAEVAELYRLSDAVLMPSHREGFGLPILEGGWVGKPVFCTDLPVLEDFEADSVHLIQAGDSPQQTALNIQRWAQQDKTQRLRRYVRQAYTWPTIFRHAIQPLLAGAVQTSPRK